MKQIFTKLLCLLLCFWVFSPEVSAQNRGSATGEQEDACEAAYRKKTGKEPNSQEYLTYRIKTCKLPTGYKLPTGMNDIDCKAQWEGEKRKDPKFKMTYDEYRIKICKFTTDPAGTATNYIVSDFEKLKNPLGGAGTIDVKTGISKIMNIVLMVAIPFITIMIMYSGYLFVAAYGDPGKLKTARATLLWTIIGTGLLLGATTLGSAIVATVKKIGGAAANTVTATTTATSTPPTTPPANTKAGGKK